MKINKLKIIDLFFGIFFIIFILFSIYYINNNWQKTISNEENKVAFFAKSVAIGLDGEMIKMLQAVPEDEGTVPYESIKSRLEKFRKLDEKIRFIYLYAERDEKLFFLVDSESSTSSDYSPSGQEYKEADEIYKEVIYSKSIMISPPVSDRWGRWVSVLVPIFNKQSGDILCVLGIDYPAGEWYNEADRNIKISILNFIGIGTLLLLVFILFRYLIFSRDNFQSLVENIPGIIYRCEIDKNWTMKYLNGSIEEITGYNSSEFINNKKRSFASIIFPDDQKLVEKSINKAIVDKKPYDIEYRLVIKNNKLLWVHERGMVIYNKNGEALYLDGFIFDISDKKEIIFEIEKKQLELENINKFMVGRELKMIELKKEISELNKKSK